MRRVGAAVGCSAVWPIRPALGQVSDQARTALQGVRTPGMCRPHANRFRCHCGMRQATGCRHRAAQRWPSRISGSTRPRETAAHTSAPELLQSQICNWKRGTGTGRPRGLAGASIATKNVCENRAMSIQAYNRLCAPIGRPLAVTNRGQTALYARYSRAGSGRCPG